MKNNVIPISPTSDYTTITEIPGGRGTREQLERMFHRYYFESIYYLAQPEKFFQEAHRVLRDGGVLLIATVNKDWSEFNPSPFRTRYFSVPELGQLLQDNGFKTEFYGAFSALPNGVREKAIATIKRIAVSLHLIPKTMKGKEFLKRIFFGKLIPLPNEITEGMADYTPPVPISNEVPDSEYKVIYAVARLQV